ncbi:MAG TPA: TIM-barrel domain-containing protein [Terriglobales bacterium]|nr:TIM-barrel domain-containing protein [Terriglobales bacterium]
MKRTFFVSFILLGFIVAAKGQTLESAALRLEVTAQPFGFRIIEKPSGDALLVNTRTVFASGNAVESAGEFKTTGNSMTAALRGYAAARSRVTFTFVTPEVLRVELTTQDAPGSVTQEFADQGEHYYGVWEYPFGGAIDNRGADYDFLGLQRLPDVNYSSARAPFYMTSRKYAIYAETTEQGHYTFARGGKTSFYFNGNGLTYDIIHGPSYAEMMKRYVEIAGGSLMPPTWAFDSIWWRDDHHADLRDVRNAQEKVIDDADRLRKARIPASAMWLDRPYGTGTNGWGNFDFDSSFPSPEKMVRELADRGMYLMVWVANRNVNSVYEEGIAKGYMFDGPWSAADIMRREVYDWYRKKLDAFVDLGIKGYKIDRGEEGEMPRSVENKHAILMEKLAAEGLMARNGPDYFNFSRNANDASRKYTAVWNGDTRATWGGLAVSVKGLLRSGAINFPMWGSDTGGYIGVPDKELFARWLEFSAYSPMMEVLVGPKRTIWYDYDDELLKIAQQTAAAHHDLIPTMRSLMYQATQTGMPVARALVFANASDEKLADLWDEFMLGDSLLVAPVLSAGATSRQVYLPAGLWLNYNEPATLFNGGTTVAAAAPLGTIPLFVREGAIIPRGDIVKTNNNWDTNWSPKLRIEVFPSATSPSRFDYFTGKETVAITATAAGKGIEVSLPELGAPGVLEVYWKNPTRVLRDGKPLRAKRDYTYDAAAHKLNVPFTGATRVQIEGGSSLFAAK